MTFFFSEKKRCQSREQIGNSLVPIWYPGCHFSLGHFLVGSKTRERDFLHPVILFFRGGKPIQCPGHLGDESEKGNYHPFSPSWQAHCWAQTPKPTLPHWMTPWNRYYHSHLQTGASDLTSLHFSQYETKGRIKLVPSSSKNCLEASFSFSDRSYPL